MSVKPVINSETLIFPQRINERGSRGLPEPRREHQHSETERRRRRVSPKHGSRAAATTMPGFLRKAPARPAPRRDRAPARTELSPSPCAVQSPRSRVLTKRRGVAWGLGGEGLSPTSGCTALELQVTPHRQRERRVSLSQLI